MKCAYCGTPLKDSSVFCPKCGARQPAILQHQDGVKKRSAFLETLSSIFLVLIRDVRVVIIALVAVVALLVLILTLVFSSGKKKAVIEDYYQALEACDGNGLLNLMPDDYVAWMSDEFGFTRREMRQYLEEQLVDDGWGEVKSTQVKFQDSEKWDRDDVEDLEDGLKDDGLRLSISKAITYEVRIRVQGDDSRDKSTLEMNVIQVDGQWYSLDAMDYAYELLDEVW